jgi:oxygen-independent coproporphyrinogen-3 oxidase
MALRLREGLDIAAYERQWGGALSQERVTALTQNGLIACENGRLCTTPRGRLLLNSVVVELAA